MLLSEVIRRGRFFSLTLIAAVAWCAGAQASSINWSNPSGSFADFSWSGGNNETGLASTDPLTGGNFFVFSTSNFKAIALNGSDSTVGDIIHVTLIPAPGKRIASISANFTGDATVAGTGAAGVAATLTAIKHGAADQVSNSLAVPDITTQGAFNHNLMLNIPASFGTIDLTLDASVHSTSVQGSSALIEMKSLNFGVGTVAAAVPLPAAIVMAPGAALVAGIATRRMKKRGA
jgi:hypothetical protein